MLHVTPSHGNNSSDRWLGYALPALLLAALICAMFLTSTGCSRGGDSAARQSDEAADVAVSDTTDAGEDLAAAAQDTADAPADSTAEEAQEKGFFAKLFNRGDDEDEDEKDEPVPVELAHVLVRDMPAYLSTTATLEPEKQAEILAKIDGEVLRIPAEEGDWVRQGDVLAELDGEVQRVSLEERDAHCRSLELDLERAQKLFEQDLASEKDLHDAQYQFEQAEAQRKAVRLQLEYTQIIAPFAGVISERKVDLGQNVAIGTSLFSIVDQTPLLARIHLPERQAQRIAPGQEVVITPDTDPDLRVEGQVVRISPVVDARTGTVKVTCQVEGNGLRLRPGSFVRIDVQTDLRAGVLAIPKRALIAEGGETYVFKAVADSVIQLPIETGLTNHTHIEVTAGLGEGDRIVSIGHGALKTGSKIREISAANEAVADSSPSN